MAWTLKLGNTTLASARTFEQAAEKAFAYLNSWHVRNAGDAGN